MDVSTSEFVKQINEKLQQCWREVGYNDKEIKEQSQKINEEVVLLFEEKLKKAREHKVYLENQIIHSIDVINTTSVLLGLPVDTVRLNIRSSLILF
jgi:hypothetical protein